MTERKTAYAANVGGDEGVSDNPTALIFAQPSGQVKRVYTTSEAAPILGVSRATVARWCDQGKVRALNVGGPHRPSYRIPESELRRLTQGTVEQPASEVRLSDDDVERIAEAVWRRFARLAQGGER